MVEKNFIEKFLAGNCTEYEAKKIANYLRKDTSAIEKYLPEKEWLQYLQQGSSSGIVDTEILEQIHYLIRRKKVVKQRVFYIAGMAATIIGIFWGVLFFNKQESIVSPQNNVAVTEKKEIIYYNSTTVTTNFRLPDSTNVIVYPNSKITYSPDYNTVKRNIKLEGTAEFSVAKNKEKPFTVFCDGLATTALGTRFTVHGSGKNVSVVLHEGKVAVRKMMDDKVMVYLEPGEKVAFNTDKNIFEKLAVKVSSENVGKKEKILLTDIAKLNNAIKGPASKKNISPDAVQKVSDVYIRFENKSLNFVLDQLAEKYQVEINYPTGISTSANIYISVDTTQTIEKILKNIATANNLELKTHAANKFYISQ